jgi:hypothetical protein
VAFISPQRVAPSSRQLSLGLSLPGSKELTDKVNSYKRQTEQDEEQA